MSFHDLACNPVGRQDAQVALTFRGSKATRSATACSNLSISSWINRWSSSSILSGFCSSESSKRCNVKESTEKRLRRRGAWYRHVTVPPLRFYLYAYSSFATTTKTPDSSQQNLGIFIMADGIDRRADGMRTSSDVCGRRHANKI